MFEFQALCNQVEALTPAERGALIAEKSLAVVAGLHALALPVDPVETLASFIIGSVISDGKIDERDLINIDPALTEALGQACDLAGLERSIKVSRDLRKEVSDFTTQMLSVLAAVDEQLGADIVLLCLLVTSTDGKVSMREKRYIRQLCKA